jgi:hypothetical protein
LFPHPKAGPSRRPTGQPDPKNQRPERSASERGRNKEKVPVDLTSSDMQPEVVAARALRAKAVIKKRIKGVLKMGPGEYLSVKQKPTVRRSIALPGALAEEISALAPSELRDDWNRLVIVAPQEYAARRRDLAFESEMPAMAADPGIRCACAAIETEFAAAQMDGLRRD